MRDLEEVREQAKLFLKYREQTKSPLYSQLIEAFLCKEEYLQICCLSAPGNPAVYSLAAAVHYLLLEAFEGDADYPPYAHDILKFYPSLVPPEQYEPIGEQPNLQFREAVFRFLDVESTQQRLKQLVRENNVQTNEVRRCAALLPAYLEVLHYAQQRQQHVDLVEFGCSAGLCTFWDLYHYSYSYIGADGLEKVAKFSPAIPTLEENEPIIESRVEELQGSGWRFAELLDLSARSQTAITLPNLIGAANHRRIGLDLNLIDLTNAHANRWFRALIWPDAYAHRVERFNRVYRVFEKFKAKSVWLEGDAILNLVENLAPHDADHQNTASLLVHSYCLYQLNEEAKQQVEAACLDASKRRDIYRISLDLENTLQPTVPDLGSHLHVFVYRGGERVETKIIASAHSHGEWVKLYNL